MPPSHDDDDWQANESGGGRMEDDERGAEAARSRRTRGFMRGGMLAGYWADPTGRVLLIISGILLVFLCAAACAVLLFLGIGVSRNVGGLFPTPTPTIVPTPTPPLEFQLQDAVKVNGSSVPPGIPTRLDIGGKSFVVRALGVDADGLWTYDVNDRRAAWWAVGSQVNYVIGLHAGTENTALFEAAAPGDLLSLETAAGLQRFRVTEKTKIAESDLSALADQSRPRVTLVMFGQGGSERDALIADYTDEGTPGEAVAFGAPVNLGDVRVYAYDYAIVPGREVGLLEGRSMMQVNLQVTNLMTELLDSAQFNVELIDGRGEKYPLSLPGTTAAGGAGWRKGVVEAGKSVTLTSAFEVPAGMPGPMLEWTFRTQPESPYVARVMIPYEAEPAPIPTPTPVPPSRLRIDVANANISPDGTEISIIGNLTNLTGDALTVSLQDVALAGADGTRAALSTSLPQVPWEVSPGATLTFKLSFVMPVQLPATLTVLDQRVVIGGN
jgi:hypothetical protein